MIPAHPRFNGLQATTRVSVVATDSHRRRLTVRRQFCIPDSSSAGQEGAFHSNEDPGSCVTVFTKGRHRVLRGYIILTYFPYKKTPWLSPRANYTDLATAASSRS
jgi:hypothetical protein